MSAPNTPRFADVGLAEALVEALGRLARRGGDERRAVALARVAVERELADAEHLAVPERGVHPPLVVGEDPQRQDLRREPVGVGIGVVVRDAEQHEQARADGRHLVAADAHGGARHALHQRPHRRQREKIATASSMPTTSPYFASRSVSVAWCAPSARSATASRGTTTR